jgi:hypothetical protein
VPQASLTRLIYASRRTPGALANEAEVRDILIASITNNRGRSITGLLVAHADWFLQALEGPETAVMETYGHICADERHTAATILDVSSVQKRSFRRWTMCARMMSSADDIIIGKLVEKAAFDPYEANLAVILGLLSHIADLHSDLLTRQHTELLGEVLRAA